MDKETLKMVLELKEEEIKAKIRECLDLSYDKNYILVKNEEKLAELLNIELKKEKGDE